MIDPNEEKLGYLAFDPGETTGYCKFAEDGIPVLYGQVPWIGLMDLLNSRDHNVKAFICEDFIIRSTHAKRFVGNKMETIQAIGAIKAEAARRKIPCIMQDSGIIGVAEKWTQISKKGKSHSETHFIDAFNHGAYYLIKKGIKKTWIEEHPNAV